MNWEDINNLDVKYVDDGHGMWHIEEDKHKHCAMCDKILDCDLDHENTCLRCQ